jgi:hypothetical protein
MERFVKNGFLPCRGGSNFRLKAAKKTQNIGGCFGLSKVAIACHSPHLGKRSTFADIVLKTTTI